MGGLTISATFGNGLGVDVVVAGDIVEAGPGGWEYELALERAPTKEEKSVFVMPKETRITYLYCKKSRS